MFEVHSLFHLVGTVIPVSWNFLLRPYVFLYLGPDTILPLASVCGALIGFVLIFWRYIVSFARRVYRSLAGQESLPVEETTVETETKVEN